MSHATNYMITCPCGMVFRSKIYEYVNTRQDPQLRYTVLAGLLNVSTCPNCGRRSTQSRPFIYSDPAHFLLVYVDPTPDISDEARRGKLAGTCEGKVAGRKRKTCCRRYYRYYAVKRGGERVSREWGAYVERSRHSDAGGEGTQWSFLCRESDAGGERSPTATRSLRP